jgi:hypothetical protein
MQNFEGKHIFIKDNISRNIDTTSRYLKTFDPFVTRTITQKDTLCRAKGKLAFIIRAKIGPTCTPKDTKGTVRWFVPKRRCTGVSLLMTLLGSMLMVKKASSQNFKGMCA